MQIYSHNSSKAQILYISHTGGPSGGGLEASLWCYKSLGGNLDNIK